MTAKKNNSAATEEDNLSKYSEDIKQLAYQLLEEGDAFLFMLDTWNLRHMGDRNLGEHCLCSIGSTYILNSERGIHIKPSGESGKGKSDAMDTALKLLPSDKFITGSISSKVLFYDESIKAGTIVYADDAHLNAETIATIKQSTSKFQEPTTHRTVNKQKAETYTIPARCVIWFSTVDGFGDDQLANRFFQADVDGSREQDLKVYQHIKDKESKIYEPEEDDLLICRCIFDILGKEQYVIKIPFINAIEWRNTENRRNFEKLLDIVRSVTLFSIKQRRKIGFTYLSTIEDFRRALSIYTGTSKSNATNLTAQEMKVLKFITSKNEYDKQGNLLNAGSITIKELMGHLEVSRQRVIKILEGEDRQSGMLAKVANLNKLDQSTTAGETTTRENRYAYSGKQLGFEVFDSVAVIDEAQAKIEEEEFIKTLLEESVTQCNPSATPNEVTVKTSTIDRIRSNVTKNNKNKREDNITSSFSHSEELGYTLENLKNNASLVA